MRLNLVRNYYPKSRRCVSKHHNLWRTSDYKVSRGMLHPTLPLRLNSFELAVWCETPTIALLAISFGQQRRIGPEIADGRKERRASERAPFQGMCMRLPSCLIHLLSWANCMLRSSPKADKLQVYLEKSVLYLSFVRRRAQYVSRRRRRLWSRFSLSSSFRYYIH